MDSFFEAIANATRLIGGALLFIFIILPVSLLCFIISYLLLPLDLIINILSGGNSKYAIFNGFQKAGRILASWFSKFV